MGAAGMRTTPRRIGAVWRALAFGAVAAAVGLLLTEAASAQEFGARGQTASLAYVDDDTPERNAVGWFGPDCMLSLIAPRIALTAAHCLPIARRAPRDPKKGVNLCEGFDDVLQGYTPWERPDRWYEVVTPDGSAPLSARFGPRRSDAAHEVDIVAYSLGHCSDLLLVRLARPVPRAVARPMRVVTDLGGGVGTGVNAELSQALARLELRQIAFDVGSAATRRTGPAAVAAGNRCHLFTEPTAADPSGVGQVGASGAPLAASVDGDEYLFGVLIGAGVFDPDICGAIAELPSAHAVYTPSFRAEIPGAAAQDLAEWIAYQAPQASTQLPMVDWPLIGRFERGGRESYLIVRKSNWRWFARQADGPVVFSNAPWGGRSDDIPLVGDLNRDGVDDLIIYRRDEEFWFARDGAAAIKDPDGGAALFRQLEAGSAGAGARPMVGDVDGDGYDDLLTYHPNTGRWTAYSVRFNGPIPRTTRGDVRYGGLVGDKPFLGDVNGDGRDDLIIFRDQDNRWYARDYLTDQRFIRGAEFGGRAADTPLVGDVDGDGRADLVVYRADEQTWHAVSGADLRTRLADGLAHAAEGGAPRLGDVDGDGRSDFVLYATATSQWTALDLAGEPIGLPLSWGRAWR